LFLKRIFALHNNRAVTGAIAQMRAIFWLKS